MKNRFLIRKNILDADMQKYLQVASVSVIVGFTYLVGIAIAFLTRQINFGSFVDISVLGIISVLILGLASFFSINAIIKIKRITKAVRDIEKLT